MSQIEPIVSLVRDSFDLVIQLYSNPEFPYIVATWMAIVAFVLIVVAFVRTGMKWWLLWERIRIVSRAYKSCDGDIDACREAFSASYPDIDNELKKKIPSYLMLDGLQLAWAEFSESLIVGDVDTPEIKNTVRPQVYFARAVRMPNWLEFWANLAVGLGLFFTFFGLVAALYRANEGVASGDMATMSASLAGLLAAASAKFVTSIMGVGLSIILKIVHKTFSAVLRSRISDLCHKLETGMLYVAPQMLATEQWKEAVKQTGIIQEQANEIGMQFREQLEPLNRTLANAAEEQRQAISDGIGNMMGEAANAEIRHMSEMLGNLSGTLDGLGDGLKESGESASAQIRDATAELVKTQEAFAASADDLAKIGPVLEQWQVVTGEAATKVDESLRSFAAVIAVMEDSVEQIETANETLREHIDKSDARIESGVDLIRQANENTAALAESLQAAQARMESSWEGYDARFADVDESLGQAVQGLAQGYQTYQDAVNGRLAELDTRLGDAVSRLATIVEEVQDAVDNIDASTTGATQ